MSRGEGPKGEKRKAKGRESGEGGRWKGEGNVRGTPRAFPSPFALPLSSSSFALRLSPFASQPPIASIKNAYLNATSRRKSYRPDAPPWPAPMLVLSRRRLPSVFRARRRAVHLAGAQ